MRLLLSYSTLDDVVGGTPLVRIQRLFDSSRNNTILVKLEGNNPAGSVKDRPALNMISEAERRGEIAPGDRLIEATSGNTGIALAMVAATRGYRMCLIMPENMSEERRALMRTFGAEIILVTREQGMEYARDLAKQMEADGEGKVLDQFGNPDNPEAHYRHTGPEIWQATDGTITHFVSAMGTTGTITGVGRYLKEMCAEVQIVGVQPDDDSQIPGIRRWNREYLPSIYRPELVDHIIDISQDEAERYCKRMASQEGIFCGVSSGGAVAAAIKLANETENATIVSIVCDRGDRYLSTGVFA